MKNFVITSALGTIKGGVVPEGAGGVMAPPDSGRSVNPILTRGAGYAHQIILAPPDFQTFLRPC